MYQITLQISDMMCSMCEKHINEAIEKSFTVTEVTSSHEKHETTVLSEQQLDVQAVCDAVTAAGYTVESVSQKS